MTVNIIVSCDYFYTEFTFTRRYQCKITKVDVKGLGFDLRVYWIIRINYGRSIFFFETKHFDVAEMYKFLFAFI